MKALILAVFLFSISGVRWTPAVEAQVTGQSQNAAEKVVSKVQITEGLLSSFDVNQRLIRIKTADSSEMQFSYTAETPLVGANRQLRIGDHLKISYEAADGVNKLISVELMSA